MGKSNVCVFTGDELILLTHCYPQEEKKIGFFSNPSFENIFCQEKRSIHPSVGNI